MTRKSFGLRMPNSQSIKFICDKVFKNRTSEICGRQPLKYLKWYGLLKVGLSPSKKKIICCNDSPSKMMKNASYFILKVLFILKIFKFLSWLSGHVEKTAWLER